MPALCARAGMDFSKIRVKLAKKWPKISPLCEGWHRFLKKLGILVKMLHEGLVWKISTGGASPLRGAGSWRSYSYTKVWPVSLDIQLRFAWDFHKISLRFLWDFHNVPLICMIYERHSRNISVWYDLGTILARVRCRWGWGWKKILC